ncbi:toxin-antitoxin system, toxin component [Streptomyces sp. NPDC101118]|uniref:toxin-antitoxin system, toxin component n=1 Tax=Streptomyces sp. NPDC101118 TaxID=3366109 RepID=UPI00382BDC7C
MRLPWDTYTDGLRLARAMKRHRDELFKGVGRPVPETPEGIFRAICRHLTLSSGREVRLVLEPFPVDTVSGLWLDMGDFDVIAVEANTSPLHQMVIMGHELWHRKEGGCGHHGAGAAVSAAARMLGGRWSLDDAVAHVAARDGADLDEERRAERFGRMLAARFRPYLDGTRGGGPTDETAGRIWACLEG